MPRTRSANKSTASEQISKNNELLDDNDSSSAPPTSFQGQLTKYEFAASDSALHNDTAQSISAKSLTKRARSTGRGKNVHRSDASFSVGKKRKTSKYAAPSKYAHLSPLVDILEPNLIGVFIGFNPVRAPYTETYSSSTHKINILPGRPNSNCRTRLRASFQSLLEASPFLRPHGSALEARRRQKSPSAILHGQYKYCFPPVQGHSRTR